MTPRSPRAPFNVLVLPYVRDGSGVLLYAVFRRQEADGGYWQGIAGGGEGNETPLEAAQRESYEEAGIRPEVRFLALDSRATIPVREFGGFRWGENVFVIPEYAFGVEAAGRSLCLSHEHVEYRWAAFDEAMALLKWDSNRNALWELDQRLLRGVIP